MNHIRDCFRFYYCNGPNPLPCVISLQGLGIFREDVLFFNIRDDDALFVDCYSPLLLAIVYNAVCNPYASIWLIPIFIS